MYPKISIITPSFNQGEFLEKTILSVLDQNYPNLEYIIIDGGSTDNSLDIIRRYADRITYWESEKDHGQAHALNKGFGKATGEILAWINSDDYYDKDVFSAVSERFTSSRANVVLGNCTMKFAGRPDKDFVDKPGRVNFRRLLRYWQPFFCPPQPAIFFRKKLFDDVGMLNENLNYAMDLDLWLKLSRYGSFEYVDQNFAYYLVHDSSKTGSGIGQSKFIPEWKAVCFQHLRSASLNEKLFFLKSFLLRYVA